MQTEDILTPREVARLLKVRVGWVFEKTRRRQKNPLPAYRIGRYLRFSRAAVLAWLETTASPKRKRAA